MSTEVRQLCTTSELQQADELLRIVWDAEGGDAPFPLDVMQALAHTGGYVAGAFTGGQLIGAAVAFRTISGSLHSHVAGVLPDQRGRGVGLALKLNQRGWAAEIGLPSISWTFDPLIRRNAYFNLHRLRAVAEEYLPNFYGAINDGVNGGDLTDRLFVTWEIPEPVDQTPPPLLESAKPLLDADGVLRAASGPVVRCAVPPDIESLRRKDPAAARRWRLALREALGGALADDYRVAGFHRSGWYLLCRRDASA
ncbi:GNAT family N-acetyltransferase [Streptomyces tubercidicus]|uniref:GNAT family N-acetyltransferase n=1 Tax=Streptomyces tubercidicus TaxID=47759 RepID=UPI003465ADD8